MIETEEYYIAFIDLLGCTDLISNDHCGYILQSINDIYKSWLNISKVEDSSNLIIKIFSDNIVIAMKAIYFNKVDTLLEFVAYMSEHLLVNKFKPRGGICKGKLYIDDVFIWGEALVKAHDLESKNAKNPRIIINEEVVINASENLYNQMIFKDNDGRFCLNYLKSFGKNKSSWIKTISPINQWVNEELNELRNRTSKTEDEDNEEIIKKMEWLAAFVEDTLLYWEKY